MKKTVMCSQCRALHECTISGLTGKPFGGHTLCDNCLAKLSFCEYCGLMAFEFYTVDPTGTDTLEVCAACLRNFMDMNTTKGE